MAACRPYRDVLTSVPSVTLPLDLSGDTKIGPPVVLRTIMGEFYFCKDSIDGYHRLAIELFPEGILRTPGVGLIFEFLSVYLLNFLILNSVASPTRLEYYVGDRSES